MPRAYMRLDPAFDERKAHYPDGAYRALVATLCWAEHQPLRGRFRSTAYLRALLGRHGRFVPFLIEQGDLVVLDDDRLYVEGWDEWQEGDWKVTERVSRIRNRPRNGPRNGSGNGDGNGLPYSGSGSGGGSGAEASPNPADRRGLRSNKTNPRALRTNPRAVAARAELAKRVARREVHQRYLRGELTEDQEQAEYRRIDEELAS